MAALFLLFGSASSVLTTDQKNELVFWHNKARSDIARAGYCGNMLEVEWQDTIYRVADNYTTRCTAVLAGHNSNRHTQFTAIASAAEKTAICGSSTYCLGENWAAGGGACTQGLCTSSGLCGGTGQPACDSCTQYCTMKNMVYDMWYMSEKTAATTTSNCKTYANGGGHCTQVTWQNSYMLGCGWAKCPGSTYGHYMTCNYGPAGNWGGQPLNGKCTAGAACSACPTSHPYCTTGTTAGLCSKKPGGATKSPTKAPTSRAPTRSPTGTRPPTRSPFPGGPNVVDDPSLVDPSLMDPTEPTMDPSVPIPTLPSPPELPDSPPEDPTPKSQDNSAPCLFWAMLSAAALAAFW